ncbi:lipase 1-like [Papilio machaon]|uniref:lipase 1-like n=1 Tax=Papilio machaon TaxID=76193 RepID=UPI001E664BFD|nr:lipase 1-like [Papilio machaon]
MVNFIVILILYCYVNGSLGSSNEENPINDILPEDGRFNFTQLARKYGHHAMEYKVTTKDGYILGLFRIRGKYRRKKNKLPVLLMHGIADSSDAWLLRGNFSLGITLANSGYDLWFGNIRGNKYSRNHVRLNPDKDVQFWDFSFHENGYYDLPAIIDRVLNETGFKKLNAIGFSQGNTIFYVLCSTRPEYNSKINVMMALAPICYIQNVQSPLSFFISISSALYDVLSALGINEVANDNSLFNTYEKIICTLPQLGYDICVKKIMFPFTGHDSEELEPSFLSVLVGHFPTSTALKTLYHFAQVGYRRIFGQFNYGNAGNLENYNSTIPPVYDLNLITTKIVLYVCLNDKISTVDDVKILRSKLPNVVRYIVSPRWLCNHIDHVWGKHMYDYLFPYVYQVLESY